ncbi:ATP-dependent RNA helicase DbpA [Nymphon striatum]|nr:ATP-dependent RNA helicase DbpA [Nymphon striatum]
MAGSLQDQLLGAGLIKKQKAKNIQTAKKKAIKQSRANNTELVDEAAELAKKAQEEQRLKSQQLNEQRKNEAQQKAILAQIRQIIELNSIPKTKKNAPEDSEVSYNFTDENKIKTIHVSPENHDLMTRGRIAVAKLEEGTNTESNVTYHLIPAEAANKISERDSHSVVLLNDTLPSKGDEQGASEDNGDDPYADYEVPDDLMCEQIANLDSLDYKKMTPVQASSLPPILEGKDLIVQAKTGSGKTAAFGVGLLDQINPRFFGVQSLVMCPTRELADQVANELRKLARCIPNIKIVVLCGGKPLGPQADSLEHGAHIAVGTPGRLQDHLSRNTLNLDGLKTLVLDEADRMLDMGFLDEITSIIRQTPKNRQTLLFSATYPDSIKKMCRSIQRDPITIKVDSEHDTSVIEQLFYKTDTYQRLDTLLAFLEHYKPETTVVFCHTKIQCDEVAGFLQEKNVDALAIHGDLEQRDRDQVLARFSNKSCSVLVATDVAARGLDIKSLEAVINYELPHDPEIYVHRIGRTGRAGEKGLALSLYTDSEVQRIIGIEEYTKKDCEYGEMNELNRQPNFSLHAAMSTLQIDAGKKNKIRPGDLLGALTKDAGLAGSQIGKINIFEMYSYVGIERKAMSQAIRYFKKGKVKGRFVKAREIR